MNKHVKLALLALTFISFTFTGKVAEALGNSEEKSFNFLDAVSGSLDDSRDRANNAHEIAERTSNQEKSLVTKSVDYITCIEMNIVFAIKYEHSQKNKERRKKSVDATKKRIEFCQEEAISLVGESEEKIKNSALEILDFEQRLEKSYTLNHPSPSNQFNLGNAKLKGTTTLTLEFSPNNLIIATTNASLSLGDNDNSREKTNGQEHLESRMLIPFYDDVKLAYIIAEIAREKISNVKTTQYELCINSIEKSVKFVTYATLNGMKESKADEVMDWIMSCKLILHEITFDLDNAI